MKGNQRKVAFSMAKKKSIGIGMAAIAAGAGTAAFLAQNRKKAE